MGMTFNDTKPIYQQLVTRICREIIRGNRSSGDKLPSVRDYAVEAGVNANTVQRVYRELDHKQITVSKRGQGTFVTEDKYRLEMLRESMKQELIDQFIDEMQEMGFSYAEMVQGIDDQR